MRVLEDVADDASVLSIKVVFVFVVVSRHHRLQIFLECDDACGREDDVACAKYYRTTRHDDAKKVVVVVDDLFENRF